MGPGGGKGSWGQQRYGPIDRDEVGRGCKT